MAETIQEELQRFEAEGICPWCREPLKDGTEIKGYWHKACYDEYLLMFDGY
jgi:hypothetical protein